MAESIKKTGYHNTGGNGSPMLGLIAPFFQAFSL